MQHECHDDIQRALGRIEGKLDSLGAANAVHLARTIETEKDIKNLRSRQSWMLGGAAVIGGLAASLKDKFFHMF